MKYYIDLNMNTGGAMVYNDFSRPKDVACYEKVGASPAEAVRRLLAEDFKQKKAVIRSEDLQNRWTWRVDFSIKE